MGIYNNFHYTESKEKRIPLQIFGLLYGRAGARDASK
jgi:hypothetical protein